MDAGGHIDRGTPVSEERGLQHGRRLVSWISRGVLWGYLASSTESDFVLLHLSVGDHCIAAIIARTPLKYIPTTRVLMPIRYRPKVVSKPTGPPPHMSTSYTCWSVAIVFSFSLRGTLLVMWTQVAGDGDPQAAGLRESNIVD